MVFNRVSDVDHVGKESWEWRGLTYENIFASSTAVVSIDVLDASEYDSDEISDGS